MINESAMPILKTISAWQQEACIIRKKLHANPEIGFEEFLTRELVIKKLTEYGADKLVTHYAKTAVIGVIHGRGVLAQNSIKSKPFMLGLRADMDALPIHEENNFEHRSLHHEKMHACGHDGHTTILLMTAKYLCLHREDFSGTIVLIFQPAEEGLGGAKTLIEEGFLQDFPLDYCFGLHNMPGLAEGHFGFKPGVIMASSDRLFITIYGKGGHAGMPHTTQDPLLVATHIYQGFQSIISRSLDPLMPAVISITQIHGGNTTNVIAPTAHMNGTFRTHSVTVREHLIKQMQTITEHTARAFGMRAEFSLGPVSHPPTVNDPECTQLAYLAARQVVDSESIYPNYPALMGSEDFAFYLEKVKGCFVLIGNDKKDNQLIGLHNPKYDFNDAIIPIGAAYFVNLVLTISKNEC